MAVVAVAVAAVAAIAVAVAEEETLVEAGHAQAVAAEATQAAGLGADRTNGSNDKKSSCGCFFAFLSGLFFNLMLFCMV